MVTTRSSAVNSAVRVTTRPSRSMNPETLLVQSNNATYGGTGQIEQQFAITRARAMESRREIAVATTNSVSGFIDRDGRVVTRTTQFTADDRVVTMTLRTSLTPAVHLAPWLDRGLTLLAVLCCALALVRVRSPRPRPDPVGPARVPTPTNGSDLT